MLLRLPVRTSLSIAMLLSSLAAITLLCQCFAPNYNDCAYRCGSTSPPCPDEYQCQQDGYCHLRGSTERCPYTPLPTDMAAQAHDLANDL